jgi:transposase-like protein
VGTEVSSAFISCVIDEVMSEVSDWQKRPLEPIYPMEFFDALWVKIRDEGVVRNKVVYPALGVHPDGTREVPENRPVISHEIDRQAAMQRLLPVAASGRTSADCLRAVVAPADLR